MLDTVQRIKHTVRMAYRESNLTHRRDTIPEEFRHFMMILFQGNGSTPQIMSIISYVVLSALRVCFGINFVNYFTTEIAKVVGFSYVDNFGMVQSDDDI